MIDTGIGTAFGYDGQDINADREFFGDHSAVFVVAGRLAELRHAGVNIPNAHLLGLPKGPPTEDDTAGNYGQRNDRMHHNANLTPRAVSAFSTFADVFPVVVG